MTKSIKPPVPVPKAFVLKTDKVKELIYEIREETRQLYTEASPVKPNRPGVRARTVHGLRRVGFNKQNIQDETPLHQPTSEKAFLAGVIEKLTATVESLTTNLNKTNSELQLLRDSLEMLSERNNTLELKIAQSQYLDAFGLKLSEVEDYIMLPLRIYISNSDAKDEVSEILLRENESVEFEVSGPDIEGSWYREMYYRLKGVDAKKYQMLAEKAASLKLLEKPQAEVDKLNAETTKILLEALEKIEEGVLQNGAVLAVKYKPNPSSAPVVITQVLTPIELAYIEAHKDILRKPQTIMDHISAIEKEEAALPLKPSPH